MKFNVILYLTVIFFLGCGVLACTSEEELYPREHVADFIKVFPEGNNEWDRNLKDIADRFGVKCIYDDITTEDVTRVWTTSSSGELSGEGLPKDSIRLKKLYTRFFTEHIFPFLNPTYTKGVLPNYIYFTYRYLLKQEVTNTITGEVIEFYVHQETNYNGMGFWIFCWSAGEFVGWFGFPQNVQMFTSAFEIEQKREVVLKNIFKRMVDAGNLEVPEEFKDGHEFDYKTEVISQDVDVSDVNYENYYKRRGFPEQFDYNSYMPQGLALVNIRQTNPLNNFCAYLWLAFHYTAEEIEQNYKDFPLVVKYYYFTVDYVKDNYGMDISRIAEPVTEDLDSNL